MTSFDINSRVEKSKPVLIPHLTCAIIIRKFVRVTIKFVKQYTQLKFGLEPAILKYKVQGVTTYYE